MPADVFDALEAEYAALDALLGPLDTDAWAAPSACPGWSVADVVLHLAQTDEMVGITPDSAPHELADRWGRSGTVDDAVEAAVAAERGAASGEVLERWRRASSAALMTLRQAPAEARFVWATVPLKARTLATTRIAEHWIHATDIAGPLGLAYPDTDRLWHVARLAQRTIPYAFLRAGAGDPPAVYADLEAPDGSRWTFGEPGAGCIVRGTAAEFCRIAAQRLDPAEARTVTATGTRADEVLALVRTYA